MFFYDDALYKSTLSIYLSVYTRIIIFGTVGSNIVIVHLTVVCKVVGSNPSPTMQCIVTASAVYRFGHGLHPLHTCVISARGVMIEFFT